MYVYKVRIKFILPSAYRGIVSDQLRCDYKNKWKKKKQNAKQLHHYCYSTTILRP